MLPGEAFRGENITDENCICYAAAGNSRRFGSNKLLYEIEGKPMYLLTLEKLKKASEKFRKARSLLLPSMKKL